MAERFPDLEIQEIQELENSENQNTKKSTSTWLVSGPAGPKLDKNFEINLLSYEAKQRNEM
mgnify:CR=1 FL=1